MTSFFFIANRFLNSNKGTGKLTGMVSTLGITIGCFALIIAVSVLNGFKSEVNKKIKDFEGDIKMSGLELNGDVWDEMYLNSKFNDSESEESEYLGERRWYDFAKYPKGYICFQDQIPVLFQKVNH